MSRQSIIDCAAAEDGTKENPPNSNKTKYGEWYQLNAVPWCAIFVSWVYNKAGHPLGKVDTSKGYQYCPSAYNFWKSHNRLTENPKMGDIVLFDWDGDGKADHTGIFIKWIEEGKSFSTWEGNTAVGNDSDGGEVMTRVRKKAVVKAFVNPGIFNDGLEPRSLVLKQGDAGTGVTRRQKLLYDLGYEMVVDGEFGPGTEAAVRKFQKDHGLPVTGVIDPSTDGAIEAEAGKPKVPDGKMTSGVYLKKGSTGAAVVALQKALNKKGTKPKLSEDGVFGSDTADALKSFQKKNGLTPDGIAGPASFRKLGIS